MMTLRVGSGSCKKELSHRLSVQSRAQGRVRIAFATRAEADSAAEKPVVFVAGGVGRTGIRVVRELTERGYKVRGPLFSPAKGTAVQCDQCCSLEVCTAPSFCEPSDPRGSCDSRASPLLSRSPATASVRFERLTFVLSQVRAGVRNVEKANAIFSGKEAPSGVGYTGKQDKKPAPIDASLVEAVKFDVTVRAGGRGRCAEGC